MHGQVCSEVCQPLLARTRGILCEGYVDYLSKVGEQQIIPTALVQQLRRLATPPLLHRMWRLTMHTSTKKRYQARTT